jgi:hypothetical protein
VKQWPILTSPHCTKNQPPSSPIFQAP